MEVADAVAKPSLAHPGTICPLQEQWYWVPHEQLAFVPARLRCVDEGTATLVLHDDTVRRCITHASSVPPARRNRYAVAGNDGTGE